MRPTRLWQTVKMASGFFGAKAIIIGCIPIVFWLLKLWRRGEVNVSDIRLLVLSYALVGAVVLIWKWFEAGKQIKYENELIKEINRLSPEHQEALGVWALRGGHMSGLLYDAIFFNTDFLDQ